MDLHFHEEQTMANWLLLTAAFMAPLACKPYDSSQSGLREDKSQKRKNPPPKVKGHTPLNSSIMLMGDWDWRKGGTCQAMVKKATNDQLNYNRSLNFVPTHYFIKGPKGPQYCHSRQSEKSVDGRPECLPLNAKGIAKFKEGMKDCFQRAIKKNIDISITPHLDDGLAKSGWRNEFDFDPHPKGANCQRKPTYYCAVLRPMAQALNETMTKETKVRFAMQGEMGRTVFQYPGSYQRVMDLLKKDLIGQRKELKNADIKIGISLNFNSISGGAKPVQKKALAQLFEKIDFIGLSAYGSTSPQPNSKDFDQTIKGFAAELKEFGIPLNQLSKTKELHFSEFGHGGGAPPPVQKQGDFKVENQAWGGVHGPYVRKNDPWQSQAQKIYQKNFYCAGLLYLSNQKPATYRVTHAYLWNLTSWDVQGLYPSSKTKEGTYRNESIAKMINDYNRTGTISCQYFF